MLHLEKSRPITRCEIMPSVPSTGSLNRGIALGLVLLAFSSLGCSRKEISSLSRPLCKVFQHWCEEPSEEKYPSGTIKSRGNVLQDENDNYVKVGLWTSWHENGQKAEEGEYKDGKRVGDWMYWRENGKKLREGQFANGREVGVWTSWYENGQKLGEIQYANGGRVMQHRFWDETGQELTMIPPPL